MIRFLRYVPRFQSLLYPTICKRSCSSVLSFLECKNRLQTFVSASMNDTELEELQDIVEQRRVALPRKPRLLRLDRDVPNKFGFEHFVVNDEGERESNESDPNTRFVDCIRELRLVWSNGDEMKFLFGHHRHTIYAHSTLAEYEFMSAGPLVLEAGFPEGYVDETICGAEELFEILAEKGCPSINAACSFLDWMLQGVSKEKSGYLYHVIDSTLRDDEDCALIFENESLDEEEGDESGEEEEKDDDEEGEVGGDNEEEHE